MSISNAIPIIGMVVSLATVLWFAGVAATKIRSLNENTRNRETVLSEALLAEARVYAAQHMATPAQ